MTLPVVRQSFMYPLDTTRPTPPALYFSYETKILEFDNPTLEITASFSAFERKYVSAKDPLLFSRGKTLILDLDQVPTHDFVFPLPGAKVISPYGRRRGRAHSGMDLKTFANDTARAAFSGIVRMSGKERGYGNVVVIRHYNGVETVYGHNSKNLVKSGDRVKAGTPISLVGRTGRASTEHVHFETRINGEHFNPNILIDFSKQELRSTCIVFTKDSKGIIRINPIAE